MRSCSIESVGNGVKYRVGVKLIYVAVRVGVLVSAGRCVEVGIIVVVATTTDSSVGVFLDKHPAKIKDINKTSEVGPLYAIPFPSSDL